MVPSMDSWIKEAKEHENAGKVGMYLTHNGVVRESAKALVRNGDENAKTVKGMVFDYDEKKVEAVIADTYAQPGIYYVKVWLNRGKLKVGDDLMYAMVGGDIRPHVIGGLEYLVDRLKKECVTETELF